MADVDWSERGDYITKRPGITIEAANEALTDPDRLVFDPDYRSQTGASVRTIGWSNTYGGILTVITVREDGKVWGANCWKANDRDRMSYEEAKE